MNLSQQSLSRTLPKALVIYYTSSGLVIIKTKHRILLNGVSTFCYWDERPVSYERPHPVGVEASLWSEVSVGGRGGARPGPRGRGSQGLDTGDTGQAAAD